MKILGFMNENNVIYMLKAIEDPLNILVKSIRLIHICELFEKPYVKIGTEFIYTY